MLKAELSTEDLYQFHEVLAKWSLRDIMGIFPNCVAYNMSIQTQLSQVHVLFRLCLLLQPAGNGWLRPISIPILLKYIRWGSKQHATVVTWMPMNSQLLSSDHFGSIYTASNRNPWTISMLFDGSVTCILQIPLPKNKYHVCHNNVKQLQTWNMTLICGKSPNDVSTYLRWREQDMSILGFPEYATHDWE